MQNKTDCQSEKKKLNIAYNNIKDNDDHGIEFLKIAEELNKKYGLSITKKIDASSFKRNEKASKLSWFFIRLFGC